MGDYHEVLAKAIVDEMELRGIGLGNGSGGVSSGSVNVANFPATQPVSAASLPLPEGAATNASLVQVRDRIPAVGTKPAAQSLPVVLSSDGPFSSNFGVTTEAPADSDTANSSFLRLFKRLLQSTTSLIGKLPSQQGRLAVIPRSVVKKFRDDFPGNTLDSSKWEVVQTGVGQSISVAGSELIIASGTTANSETIIRSKDTYTIAFRVFAIARTTQRIANQELIIEIVDATGTHFAQWKLEGTSGGNIFALTANSGSNTVGQSTINLSGAGGVGGGTSNNYVIYEIEAFLDEINFIVRNTDSTQSRAGGLVRTRQIPDPNLEYFVQIRVKNLANAPASSTSFMFDSIAIQDIEELTAELTGGRGGGNANQAIPAQITNASIPVAITGTTQSPVPIGDIASQNLETSSTLAANGIFVGTTKPGTGAPLFRNTVRGWVFTDQPGTLNIEQSTNASTWRQTHSWAVPVSNISVFLFEFKMTAANYRVRYVNGTSAQSVFEIITTQFGIGA